MAFLQFDKAELVNLEYSLSREAIRSNRAGSYASTTISGCNTRKYHGLLICPLEYMDGENHVLLSSLDATVIQHDKAFNLGIHKYEGDNYAPKGHKYLRDFEAEKGSKMTFRVGGVVLSRETMLVQKKEQILVKYTLEDAHSETKLQLRPFLAFRNVHKLSKANLHLNRQYSVVENGICSKMYEGYPNLFMQVSKAVDFVPVPDWYYNVEYMEEQKRGYEYKEDLYVPGYFELTIKKGESVIFSASLEEEKTAGLKRKFQSESALRTPLDSFKNCLVNSAQQFFVRTSKKTEMIAGFPWYGIRARDTFIALPGLAMSLGDFKSAKVVIDTLVGRLRDGLFPGSGKAGYEFYNSIDAPLWFIWTLQQYAVYDPSFDVWRKYKKPILEIFNAFRNGTSFGIGMNENGLIYGGEDGIPVTWMDAMVHGRPITPRKGFPVEANALWYNAVSQLVLWTKQSDPTISAEWEMIGVQIQKSFVEKFWSQQKGYLADYVDGDYADFAVRPNMVIATSLPFSPLTVEMKKGVLDIVKGELLTPRGLRTLSPKNPAYKGIIDGDQEKRERASHQGSVYAWLLEHFVQGYLDVHKRSGIKLVNELYAGFEENMTERGVGTISELFDGNPPYNPKGAISFASSVASLLRIGEKIEKFQ